MPNYGMTLNSPPPQQGPGGPDPTPAPPLPAMDPTDRDMMIRTIAGEAGNQPMLGQAAVAHVILNRVAAGGYGDGISGVVKAPVKPGSSFHQFSVWNAPGMQDSSKTTRTLSPADPQYGNIGAVVDAVHQGVIPDPTNGATHYWAPAAMPGGRPPPWGPQLAALNQVKIGDQVFAGGASGPGQAPPPNGMSINGLPPNSQITGGYGDIGALGG